MKISQRINVNESFLGSLAQTMRRRTAKVLAITAGLAIVALPISLTGRASTVPLGTTTVYASGDSNSAGTAQAYRYVASSSSSIGSISVYVDTQNTATKATVGVYTDSGGNPKTLLTTGSFSPVGGWNTVAVPAVSVNSGTTYWIALLGLGGMLPYRDNLGQAAATTAPQSASASLTSLPAAWVTGVSGPSGPAAFYASSATTVFPTPTPTATSSPVTITNLPCTVTIAGAQQAGSCSGTFYTSSTPSPSPTLTSSPSPTPSSAPSPTPSSTPAPTTVGFPSAASTGYPHGLAGDTRSPVTLGPQQGALTISTSGTYSGLNILGGVTVTANNVTIKNSRIRSAGAWGILLGQPGACNTNLVVQDTEVDGGGGSGYNPTTAAINQYNYCKPDSQVSGSDPLAWSCLRCDIHDNEDGVKLSSRNLLQDSWIHNLYHPTSTHHSDGFQMSDGAWSTVRHNFIDVGIPGEPFTDGSLFIDAEVGWGGVHDVTLDNNLIKGGLYPVWIYDEQKSGATQITGTITVTNNRIYRRSFDGSSALINNDGTYVHSYVQAGNAWFDAGTGGPAGQAIPDLNSSGPG